MTRRRPNRALEGRQSFPDCAGITVRLRRVEPHTARLTNTLGVTVEIDPGAPEFCCTDLTDQRRQHGPPDSRRQTVPTRDSSGRGGGDLSPHRSQRSSDAC